jgi:hypothetical protein
MEHTNYIGAGELVFSTDKENGINSGGFDVKSIMMKAGISPIMTLNGQSGGGVMNKVSDLFDSLVIPNWALSYNNRIIGGHGKSIKKNYDSDDNSDDNSDDENNQEIDDDLHDKLLDLVREHDMKTDKEKTDKEKKGGKKTRKSVKTKKSITKKKK